MEDDRLKIPMMPSLMVPDFMLACIIAADLQRRWRIAVFTCYALALVYVMKHCTTGDQRHDFTAGSTLVIQLLAGLLFLFTSNPLHEFRHEQDPVPAPTLSYLRRAYWSLCVLYSPRGVGWSFQVKNVPPRPSASKWAFVRQHLQLALRYYVLIDLGQAYQRAHPEFFRSGIDPFSVQSHGCLQRCLNVTARFSALYGGIGMNYSLLAVVMVGLGISEPRNWPSVFGKWSDAYTVRKFWGRTYHQLLRRYTSTIGKGVCYLLNLRQGSQASSHIQLYVGFAVSGLIHCGGDLMVSRKFFGVSFPFFFSQAIVITVEDVVIEAARRMRIGIPEQIARCMGYAWVVMWLSTSLPYLGRQGGCQEKPLLPFSLLENVLKVLEIPFGKIESCL